MKKKFKTLVVVSNSRYIQQEFDYFIRLFEGRVTKSRITKEDAIIETDTHRVHIMVEGQAGRGHRCHHLIYLGVNETLRREVYEPTVREFEPLKF